MSFLPIAERELRVAARQAGTFRLRIVAALTALVIGGGFFAVLLLPGAAFGGAANVGEVLFSILTWISLAAALSAGLFLTSDCLSWEKREGTLGFLFLTELRGHDVVLGKLLSTSLRGLYALLAVFPILGITVMLGGVTGAQFWQTNLALVNALFISLSAGMVVSALTRESQTALAATLALLLLLVAGAPILDAVLAHRQHRAFAPFLSLASPGYLFVTASAPNGPSFWIVLLINLGVGSTMLGLACVLIPRTWQDKTSRRGSGGTGTRAYAIKFGRTKFRTALRLKLIDLNPVLWLSCRERWQGMVALLVALTAVIFVAILLIKNESGWWITWGYFGGLLNLMVYLGTVSHAARFFVETRHNGLLELLLVTPLTARQIVQGHWRGVGRMFGFSLALFLGATLLGAIIAHQMTAQALGSLATLATTTATTNATTGVVSMTASTTNAVPTPAGARPAGLTSAVIGTVAVGETLTVAANLTALIWFGMWMGATSSGTNLATLKTLVFVQVVPWFVITFATSLAMPLVLMPRLMAGAMGASANLLMIGWLPLIMSGLTTVLCLGKDLGFIWWARRQLLRNLRHLATRSPAPVFTRPPAALNTAGVPPIMAGN